MTHAVVSVIVAVRNAAMVIGDLLEALAAQAYVGPFEVIVVDHGSTDGTSAIATVYHHRFASLSVLDAPDRLGGADARNRGVMSARGDVLVFCEAGDVVDSSWLDQVIAPLIHADLVVAGGGRDGIDADATPLSVAVRADVFRRLDGFRIDTAVGRDAASDVVRSAEVAGYRVTWVRAPDAPSALRPTRVRHYCGS